MLAGPRPGMHLSRREHQIAALVAQAFTNKKIALVLDIKEQTVKNMVHDILTKTGCQSRVEIALKLNGVKV